jgi:hypothetical protein
MRMISPFLWTPGALQGCHTCKDPFVNTWAHSLGQHPASQKKLEQNSAGSHMVGCTLHWLTLDAPWRTVYVQAGLSRDDQCGVSSSIQSGCNAGPVLLRVSRCCIILWRWGDCGVDVPCAGGC